jgi:hypothetical protein
VAASCLVGRRHATLEPAARPPHAAPMSDSKKRESQTDQEGRVTASLAGLAFVLVLVIVGLFLVRVLKKQSELEDCLMSGRTNCAPIESTR